MLQVPSWINHFMKFTDSMNQSVCWELLDSWLLHIHVYIYHFIQVKPRVLYTILQCVYACVYTWIHNSQRSIHSNTTHSEGNQCNRVNWQFDCSPYQGSFRYLFIISVRILYSTFKSFEFYSVSVIMARIWWYFRIIWEAYSATRPGKRMKTVIQSEPLKKRKIRRVED